MKKTDIYHVVFGIAIFLIVWLGLELINPNINGVWFGLLVTILVATFKEFNDQFGWVKFLLTDGKTKTGFDGRDWWLTVLIPLVITIIAYI